MVEGRRSAGGKASSDARTGHRAGSCVNPKLRAYGSKHAWAAQAPTFDRARPPAGAQCGKAARWDLSGGTGATRPPTATDEGASDLRTVVCGAATPTSGRRHVGLQAERIEDDDQAFEFDGERIELLVERREEFGLPSDPGSDVSLWWFGHADTHR